MATNVEFSHILMCENIRMYRKREMNNKNQSINQSVNHFTFDLENVRR